MAEPSAQEPDWFKKFKEANTKAAEPGSGSGDPSSSTGTAAQGDGSERRRHHRFDINDTSLTLYRHGLLTLIGVGKENKAKVAVNLAEGGLQVIIRERLAVGAKVKVRLEIEKFRDAIETTGVVRWCYQNSKKKDDFHAGIQFEDLNPAEGRKIASMREWFTSPAFRAMRETKSRANKKDGLSFPS